MWFRKKVEPHKHTREKFLGVTKQEGYAGRPQTVILCKCPCERVWTFTMDGHWTLEDLNG